MRFGIVFANTGTFTTGPGARALATAAEAAGFDSLWTVEHVVVPSGYESRYPYSPSGRMPGGENLPIPDPFAWLAYVAACTSDIKLATGIAILPERSPLVTAKEVATIDAMSDGRFLLGVGAGWLKEEFDVLGVPFERRGARLEEYIEVLRTAWRDEKATYEGEFVSFRDCIVRPAPAQGTVPIHIGGHTEVAARRAGRLGDGFFPATADAEVLPPLLTTMRRAAEDAGRDPDAIEVTAGGVLDADGVARLAEIGVHRVVIPPLSYDTAAVADALGRFADDVMAKVG